MKKNLSAVLLKCLALAATLITLVLTLAACGRGASVIGTWCLESVEGTGSEGGFVSPLTELQEWGGSAELVFKEGGEGNLAVSLWGMENESPFDYSVKGDILTISGSPLRFSINNDTLSLMEDGIIVICTKR
ncbi:MAG: hypothetical protein IKI84_07635 [Clostridia bacterium]|nr:hypothetical protein [Clostridia bacterium]